MRIDWSKLPPAPSMRPGATRRAVAGDLISAVRVEAAPDASFTVSALHTHVNEQLLVMVAGSLELEVEGERYWVYQGDMAWFRPGFVHGAVGVGDEGAVYYELFSPPRYDQLPGFVGESPLRFS